MNKLKRIFCLLMACSFLLLSACSPENNESALTPQSSGRYVETDITPPIEGQFISFLKDDGTILCYSQGLKDCYESTDGGSTWRKSAGPGANTEHYQEAAAGTLLSDGRLIIYVPEEGLLLIAQDGASQPYPVADIDDAIAKGENVSVSLLQAVSADSMLLSYTLGGNMQITRTEQAGGNAQGDGEGSEQSDSAPQNAGPVTNEGLNGQNGGPLASQGPQDQSQGPQGQSQGPQGQSQGPQGQGEGGQPANEGPQGPGNQGARSVFGGGMKSKTMLYDIASGKPIAELPLGNIAAADADDTTLYLLDSNGSVKAYSLVDGKTTNSADIRFWESENRGEMMMGMPGMAGSSLAVSSTGLYAAHNADLLFVPHGGALQTVLASTAYSTGTPRSNVNGVYALEDGSILINLRAGQANRLYKYVWDENATLDPNKTLAVWSLEDNAFVRAAIAQLRKNHPDSSITYEVALSDGDAVLAADAIKTLNTQLLNGSGPDIIILDGCPVGSYVDKGMLLDLSALAYTEDVYANLLSAYISDGKLYSLPMQFKMPLLMGSASALDKASTLDSLVGLVTAGNDTPAGPMPGDDFSGIPEEQRAELYFNDLRELCKVLWLASAPSIVLENKLNTDALGDYLSAVKAISDKYNLTNSEQGERMRMSFAFSDGGAATELPGSLVRYTSQQTNYAAFTAGNLQLLQIVMERAGSQIMLFPGLSQGVWEPSTVTGISADTKVPEFAAEFVNAMLTKEVQQLNYGIGLPVTRQGIAAQVEIINERLANEDRGAFTIDVGSFIEQLQTPSMGDMTLTDMMWSSVEKCCKGTLSVEEAVKEIEQNVKNYLAERA